MQPPPPLLLRRSGGVTIIWRLLQALLLSLLLSHHHQCSVATLPPMLHIEWSKLPEDRPVGTQDSFFGVLNRSFIVALGNRAPQHPPPYRPGSAKMWNGGHSLPLSITDPGAAVWTQLPHDSPATTLDRGKPGYSVNNAAKIRVPVALGGGEGLISAGGFAHHACNSNTVLLRDDLTYKLLPDFPYPNELATVAAVGTKLYAIGGMLCTKGHEHASGSAWVNSTVGKPGPVGRKVWTLDLSDSPPVWKDDVPELPGTPRYMGAAAVVGTHIYVIGGETSAKNLSAAARQNCTSVEDCGAAALDNWKLDTTTSTWTRLPSLPPSETSSSCVTEGVVVWRGRYILCMGTDQPKHTIEYPSTSTVKPTVGRCSQLNQTCSPIPATYEAKPSYFNAVTVFDVATSTFGSVTSRGVVPDGCPQGLPINCFAPQVAILEDSLWMTGGECDPAVIGGKSYWHYPEVTFFGNLTTLISGREETVSSATRAKSDDVDTDAGLIGDSMSTGGAYLRDTTDNPTTRVHHHNQDYHNLLQDSTCKKCPTHSDVIATSRGPHFTPVGGPYNTFSMMEAFHATRLDWVYTTNSSFIAEVHQHVPIITAAMNPQVLDPGGAKGTGTAGAATIGRVLNIHGQQLTAPWMRAWDGGKGGTAYGCINNPDYLKIAYEFGASLIKLGADSIQHDDPAANGEAVSWAEGDPEHSGCYCSHCMSGFTATLNAQLNATEQARLNVTAQFNYRKFLLENPWNSTRSDVQTLRKLFVAYQQNRTEAYIVGLRAHVDAAASKLGKEVTYSCNNGASNWGTPYHLFDYGMGEMSSSDANPETVEALFTSMVPAGKMQVCTMPKNKNVSLDNSAAFTQLVRATIAHSYAVGGHVMVPWDIYLPTPHAARYYGNGSQYADLYAFVRAHAQLLDETIVRVKMPPPHSEGRYTRSHTGKGGDGLRFRFPWPYTSPDWAKTHPHIGGNLFSSVTLLECESNCDNEPGCNGIWYHGGTCYTIDRLEVGGTGLVGASYARRSPPAPAHPAPAPLAACSAPNVHLLLRRSLPSVAPAIVAIHVVDWRHTVNWSTGSTINQTFPALSMNLSNAILNGSTGCEQLKATLHTLGGGSSSLKGACNGAVTTFTLDSPTPWAIVEVRSY